MRIVFSPVGAHPGAGGVPEFFKEHIVMNNYSIRRLVGEYAVREDSLCAVPDKRSSNVANLSDAELLCMFMNGPMGSRMDKVNAALNEYQGLVGVLRQCLVSAHDDMAIGETTRSRLLAAVEIAQRSIASSPARGDVLSSPEHVRHYLALKLANLENEVFAGLFLDNRHRVIEYRELFFGTIDSAAVYPREVARACLRFNAAAMIFAHNHPSGVAEPSDTDVRLTRKLVDALALIDVRVLDHLIIGQGTMTSLAERGLM